MIMISQVKTMINKKTEKRRTKASFGSFSHKQKNNKSKSGFSKRSGFGDSKRTFGNNPKRSQRNKGGSKINESLFINKAVDVKEEVYVPKHSFRDFGFDKKVVDQLILSGYKNPSPIQDQSIPVILKGNDIVGIANTGTGKTAAFLLPLITKMLENKNYKAIVLAPTRELALQIEQEFKKFTKASRLFSVSCVGGMPIYKQINEIKRGVSIVIGTPGRVGDLIRRDVLKMDVFDAIVLDEADRMLDMGFIDEIKNILSLMKKERQSLFFSATIPPAIQKLCDSFLENPITISVKTRDTASSVDQDVVRVRPNEKIDTLDSILKNPEFTKVLIFREMKKHVDNLADDLRERGFKVSALHGDMRNRERERSVKLLATGGVQILIATDVAARGIDIKDVSHVINFDTPRDYETYIHRIGRTGRGSAKGHALTFI